jgi:signal transduction histidine kinase
MEADARLLFQAFSNLLANAIKYSPNGGLITIDATTADGHASVELTDRGVGIPEVDQQRIFDRYFRGSNITGIVGTGIGLYLVKTVVDLHGGSVSVASQVGNGTQFSVRLPERARLREAEA